jgi:predicted SAM-dependent methyltransferase
VTESPATKIIIGAGGTSQFRWQSLERSQLDMRNRADWEKLFRPNSLEAVLSEHVLEHLTADEAQVAARNIFAFLAPGGYWRIAVPDANNPDSTYQDYCRPGGPGQTWMKTFVYGSDEPDHQVHYNLSLLSSLLCSAGFAVVPLEFYDQAGRFHRWPWRESEGWVRRSSVSGYLLFNYLWAGCWNTSLIVDAIKPHTVLEDCHFWRGDLEW